MSSAVTKSRERSIKMKKLRERIFNPQFIIEWNFILKVL